MKHHANAALSLKQRERMVRLVIEDGEPIKRAAERFQTSARTCSKWVKRFETEGLSGLRDRSSAPKVVANRSDPELEELICALRRLRFTAPELADLLDRPCSTISAILKRSGMGKLGRLGLEPVQRYEREHPGELIHIDVKKLGRIEGGAGKRVRQIKRRHLNRSVIDLDGKQRGVIGWDFVHVAVDDATRLAYAEVLPDETAVTAVGFLRRAIAFFERHGIQVERVITDNGSPYRSTVHAIACRALGVRHLRTRPYRPQTNGKAERFIRTMLGGWAYGAIYGSSHERTAALDGWLWHYNHRRRHQAIGRQPPITRVNNLLGTYS
jgi:transposase InsO family protein/transposase-like protein